MQITTAQTEAAIDLMKVAQAQGFTDPITADGGPYTLFLLVKPGTDLDDRFRAYDVDGQEWLNVNGWLFSYEEGH